MSYEIDYLKDEKIIIIKNTGEITFADFLGQTRKALELARKKCQIVLIGQYPSGK